MFSGLHFICSVKTYCVQYKRHPKLQIVSQKVHNDFTQLAPLHVFLKFKNIWDPFEKSDVFSIRLTLWVFLLSSQLPPVLVDLLEKSQSNIFYNGCVITEVRDYRQSGNGHNYTTRYVLLRPTAQVNKLTAVFNYKRVSVFWIKPQYLILNKSVFLCIFGLNVQYVCTSGNAFF